MRHSLNLKQTALIAALASAYPLQAMANAGVTQFSVGDVTVQRASANTPLASGSRIESGDLITTGNSGRTQLRFTDGGMVSLQPNSQFKISRYADAGDGKQDSFLVDLARGGMRALTGLIGKRNRDNYKVTTSTATIGIRGSGFSMAYNSDGTLSVTTEQDAIEVCTQGGCIGLNLGESALVTSAGALPRRVEKRAVWNPPNPRRLVGARNDDVDSEGKTATVPRQVFTNLAFTGAGLSPEGSANIRGYIEGAALVEGGVLQGFRARNNDQGDSGTVTELARTGSIEGGDFMLLGTWQAANWSGANPATLAQSGFVIGQPTPENAFAAASGLRGKYDLVAGTPVYSSAGASGTLLPSSNVMVDFRSAGRQLDINLDVQMGSNQEVPSTLPINYYGGLLNMRGTATTSGSGFSSSLNIVDTYSGDTEGAGTAYGFFGGPQAGSLGLSFTGNTQSYGALAGAGVFSREPNSITDQNVDSLGYRLHVLDGSDHFFADDDDGDFNNTFVAGEGIPARFNGTQLQGWRTNSSNAIQATGSTARYYGSVGTLGQADFLGWGSWATANHLTNSTTPVTDVHYIVGKPTTNMPTSGYATYSLIGGSIPTSTSGGTGHLLSSSYLTLDLNNYTNPVYANINVQFGADQISINGQAQLSGSSFRSIGCGNGFFSGFFTGPGAERAGLVYGRNDTAVGNVRGSAAFQQNVVVPLSD